MIALLDYGIGNLRSVHKALLAVGPEVSLTSDPEEIRRADKLILPGVGAFGDGMLGLKAGGFTDVLREAWLKEKPILGICLGMQLLFDSSEEAPEQPGLGYLAGQVRRFPDSGLKVPHTGWNQLHPVRAAGLLDQIEDGCYAYFNHAYTCAPQEPARCEDEEGCAARHLDHLRALPGTGQDRRISLSALSGRRLPISAPHIEGQGPARSR